VERVISTMRWGLIPSWSRDEELVYSTFNTRAKGLETKQRFAMRGTRDPAMSAYGLHDRRN
jgi:putative SOS response-associated peptidase YedK